MLNIEKYANNIKDVISEDGLFSYNQEQDTFDSCSDENCVNCHFNCRNGEWDSCIFYVTKWLYYDNKEVTKPEYIYCLSVNNNYYLRKNLQGDLISLYDKYPESSYAYEIIHNIKPLGLNFECIKDGMMAKVADIIEKYENQKGIEEKEKEIKMENKKSESELIDGWHNYRKGVSKISDGHYYVLVQLDGTDKYDVKVAEYVTKIQSHYHKQWAKISTGIKDWSINDLYNDWYGLYDKVIAYKYIDEYAYMYRIGVDFVYLCARQKEDLKASAKYGELFI